LKADAAQFGRDDINLYPIPFFEVLEEALKEVGKGGQSRKYIVMRNTVALGASIGISGYDEELLYEAIRNEFKGRKAEAAELNVAAVRAAAAYARSHFAAKPERRLLPVPVEQRKSRMLIKGFQAVGIAKLAAGPAPAFPPAPSKPISNSRCIPRTVTSHISSWLRATSTKPSSIASRALTGRIATRCRSSCSSRSSWPHRCSPTMAST